MGNAEHLTVGEFQRGIERMERFIESTIGPIRDDVFNHEGRLAVVEESQKAKTRKTAGWSAAAVTIVMAIVEGARAYFGGK